MGKIFVNQNALRFSVEVNVDITGSLVTHIKYKKPDDSIGFFIATIDDAEEGIMYYDVVNTTEIDQVGTWIMWAYIQFSDGRIAQGEPVKVEVHEVGEII